MLNLFAEIPAIKPPAGARRDPSTLPDIKPPPGAVRSQDNEATEQEVDIPSKWFHGARGYEKALPIQEQTKAYMFIYFSRPNTPDEKGLCRWFENRGLKKLPVRKVLRNLIKVKVVLPGNPRNQDLAEKFWVNKTPAVYVVRPDGWRNRIKVFNWENNRPKLKESDEIAELIRQYSTARETEN
jgi:hypothetical protein